MLKLSIKTGQEVLFLPPPLKMELVLYLSVLHQKRPDFDGIGHTCTNSFHFLLSQQSFWAQKTEKYLKIDQVMNV